MKWVTWENVGVDRMVCARLIRKHVDLKAEFLFLPEGTKAVPKGARGIRYSGRQAVAPRRALLVSRDP